MSNPQYSDEEVGRRGREIYEQTIRAQVETNDNIGKIVVIDAETGDFEIDTVGFKASRRLRVRHPKAVLLGLRIGYEAVDSFGGGDWGRTKR